MNRNTDRSADWHERRRLYLGASDVAAALGASPWKTPLELWLEKTGRATPARSSDAMTWGTRLEPTVARATADALAGKILAGTYAPVDGCLRAQIDRMVQCADGRALVEIKTARTDEGWGSPDDELAGIPEHYQMQLLQQWHLARLRLKHPPAFLALGVLIGGSDHRIYRTGPADVDMLDRAGSKLAAQCVEWWSAHVVADVAPPPRSTAEARLLHPKSEPESVLDLPPADRLLDIVASLREAKALARDVAAEIDRQEAAIMEAMGSCDALTHRGATLATWRTVHSSRTDWRAIAETLASETDQRLRLAELLAEHSQDTLTRRFLLKPAASYGSPQPYCATCHQRLDAPDHADTCAALAAAYSTPDATSPAWPDQEPTR